MRRETRERKQALAGLRAITGEDRMLGTLVRVIHSGKQALDAVMLEMGRMVGESIMLMEREEIAGPDGQSQLRIEVVSVTRELTRTNPGKRSDETQRLRSGDRFRRYTSTAQHWPIWWGEAKAKPASSKS